MHHVTLCYTCWCTRLSLAMHHVTLCYTCWCQLSCIVLFLVTHAYVSNALALRYAVTLCYIVLHCVSAIVGALALYWVVTHTSVVVQQVLATAVVDNNLILWLIKYSSPIETPPLPNFIIGFYPPSSFPMNSFSKFHVI